jgi:hypothetical protein
VVHDPFPLTKEAGMTRRVLAAVALTALVPFALPSATRAGGKGDLDVKGEMKIGNHPLKGEAGRFYIIRVTGKGYNPFVNVNPGFFYYPNVEGMPFEANAVTRYFFPKETREYRLYITPSPYGSIPEGPLEYTLQVKRIPLSKKPLVKEDSKLTDKDPAYDNPKSFTKTKYHKAFPVKLEAGRFYVIDMARKGKEFDFKDINSYVLLENPDGKVVTRDTGGGGAYGHARLVIQPKTSGMYRIIATSQNDSTGEFTLTVRSQLKEKKE